MVATIPAYQRTSDDIRLGGLELTRPPERETGDEQ